MLDVRDLHAFRGSAHVLRGVSLGVGEAEVVGLVGRNGAGKTTTLECIMGLVPVRSGRIAFRDQDLTHLPAHRRARLGIGYAPEDCGLFPDLTVAEHLAIGAWMRTDGRDGEELVRTLFPELTSLWGRRALLLSGGEKKMLAIARAIATGPSILLLDEAFEGLAPVVVSRFAEAVQRIKAAGISILVAESNVRTAARVSDRLYVIDRGEILFGGAPSEVLQNEEVMRTLRG